MKSSNRGPVELRAVSGSKLSDKYLGELRVVAGKHVEAIEDFLASRYEFADAVTCLRSMLTNDTYALKPLLQRYESCISHIEESIKNTPKTSFITRYKLNRDLRDMRSFDIQLEFKKLTDMMIKKRGVTFVDSPLADISFHRNKYRSAQAGTLFNSESDPCSFVVTFQNGKKLIWSTLQKGEELKSAKHMYNDIKQEFYIEVPSSEHRVGHK